MKDLTDTQANVAEFCRGYLARNDTIPTTRAIQKHFGWASQTTAINALKVLVTKGIMEESPESGKLRFVRPKEGS